MRDDRDELVFQTVGCLGFRSRLLRGFVEPRAIQRLCAVLRHRHHQRPVLFVEAHRRREIERQHTDHGVLDQQRDARRRGIATVRGEGCGLGISLLPLLERRDEDRLAAADGLGCAEAGLDRRRTARLQPSAFRIQRLEGAALHGEKRHFAARGPHGHAPLLDDHPGDGIEGDRLRERGGQPVQPARARRECAAAGFARPQRELDLLAFGDFLVCPRSLHLGVVARPQGVLVLPRPIERLGGARAQRLEVHAVVFREFTRPVELELRERHDAASDHQRDGRQRRPGVPAAAGRRLRVFTGSFDRQFEQHRRASSDRIRNRTLFFQCNDRWQSVVGKADGARDLGLRAVGAHKEHDGSRRPERMKRLLKGGFDRSLRGSGLGKRACELRHAPGALRRAHGLVAGLAIEPRPSINATGEHAERQPSAKKRSVDERRGGPLEPEHDSRFDDEHVHRERRPEQRQHAWTEPAEPHAQCDRQRKRCQGELRGIRAGQQDFDPRSSGHHRRRERVRHRTSDGWTKT